MNPEDVRITSPCPVQLDPARAANGVRAWHCGHCDKAVHVLSNMTEREAREFLVEQAGKDLCVTYAVRKDGSIRFAPEPVVRVAPLVPVAALARRRTHVAAAVGLGLALAACAPHDNPKIDRPSITATDTPVTPPRGPVMPTQPPPPVDPDEQLVDGGMRSVEVVAGGLRAEPVADEPCDPPQPTGVAKRGKMRPMSERAD